MNNPVTDSTPNGFKETRVGRIPSDWDCVMLTSVAKLESGHTPSRNHPEYWDGDVPWVSLHDAKELDRGEIYSTKHSITDEGIKNSSARILPPGTVVFSRTATVGKASTLGRAMATSQDFANFICGDQILNQFLVHLFRSMGHYWKRLMAGSTHNTIYMPDFQRLHVALPPLREQEKIAEVLSKFDQLIWKTEAIIAAKQERKRSLMQQLLSGEKRVPGFTEEWQEVRLDEVATNSGLRNKGTVPDERLYAVTKAKGLIPMREHVKGATTDRCRVVKHDWFAYNPMRLNIGSLARLHEKEPAMVSPDYVVFRCNEKRLDPDFLDHFRHTRRWQHYVNIAGNGSVRVRIYFKDLGGFKFSLPPIEEQRRIAEILNACDREIVLHRRQLEAIREQKRGLMQKLLTGEVRVKVD